MFPWLFKHNKLGPVIGTRTWGGLVGISGNPSLIDGGTIAVPTLEGGDVSLRLKPGTQSGSRHRVKGHGIGAEGKRGDLIVTVEVDVPGALSADEQRAVEELARVLRSPRGEESRSK